jgi:NAD(P)-dependent dehydrogenase (short-subunit alcohol dehydrogenase family)
VPGRLEGKVALITGAAMGQGAAEARLFAAQGARVAVTDIADTTDVATELGDLALALSLDVTQAAQWAGAVAATVERFGRLDILVNNAGITGGFRGAPSEVTAGQLREVYDTNVFGVVTVTNHLLPLLRRSAAGRIVNMSSGLGSLAEASDPDWEFASYNLITYQSSKTALSAVTIAYAKELRETGIKVNAADPGFTATDLNQHRGYRTVEQAAVIAVRLATLGADGPTGTFQDENGTVPW